MTKEGAGAGADLGHAQGGDHYDQARVLVLVRPVAKHFVDGLDTLDFVLQECPFETVEALRTCAEVQTGNKYNAAKAGGIFQARGKSMT
jgi:hypothetical protein